MLEVVANILNHLLLCSCRKTRHRYACAATFTLLIFLYKPAYIQIVNTKILSPSREAMCLVNDKSHHMTSHEYLLYGLRAKHLGGYIQQRSVTALHTLYGKRA